MVDVGSLKVEKGWKPVGPKKDPKTTGKMAGMAEDTSEDITTGDDKTGDDKTNDGKTGDGKTGDGKTGDGKTGDGKTGDGKTGDGKTGDGKTQPDSGNGDSKEIPSQKRYSASYKVCGQLTKGTEKVPETPSCVTIDKLDTPQASGAPVNRGQQMQIRGASDTSAVGIK
jgi:uncharacterized low-complexity protein